MVYMRSTTQDRCEVQCLDLSVMDSDVRLIWKSEIDVIKVLGKYWTCCQHLQYSPIVPHVELLQRLEGPLCQIRASGSQIGSALRAAFFPANIPQVGHTRPTCGS